MADSKEYDDTEYELDVGDSKETEVEVPEPSEPQPAEQNEQDTATEEDSDGKEHEEYSASVKKRIDRLTKKMREAERQREEALRYAQGVQSEAETIRQRMQQLDQGYLTEYGGRLSLEQQQAEAELRRAVEMGDAEATVAAQRKLTNLAIAANQYETVKNQQAARQQQVQQPIQQPVQQPAPQQQRPDPKAEQWAGKNQWFGEDKAMTFAAFGIHKDLVETEGFDPQSDEYYSELDRRIRKEFPQKFSGASKRNAQTVAGVSRTTSNGRRRVKLSPSQVAIAKKLGVPLEEYAKYVKEQ